MSEETIRHIVTIITIIVFFAALPSVIEYFRAGGE